ncbi:hypothetical protein BT93_C2586 [Corymbia citriodora subsp. variegata]|nr:hypothetical protein BT93_C2586 [Corymbia citriodora subsp. variegata]
MQSTPFLPSTLPCHPPLSLPESDEASGCQEVPCKGSRMRREEDYRHEQYSGGRLVDQDMIVLRKRIHEVRTAEQGLEPPPEWMEWEKRCYASYDSIILEIVGFLQSRMMNARPGIVLGVAALCATSSALVLFRLVEMAREILATYHLFA